jgi:hypothetical protein
MRKKDAGRFEVPQEPIGQQDLLTAARRALGLQRPTPELLSDRVDLDVQLTDLERPEYLWLRRGSLFQAGENLPAGGAGTFATAQLTAPSSTKLVVVDRVYVGVTGACTLLVGLCGLAALATRTIQTRDARSNLNSSAIALTSGIPGVAPAPFFGPITFTPAAAAFFTIEGPWVLTGNPLLAFTISVQTANVGMSYGITWWERGLLPQEV